MGEVNDKESGTSKTYGKVNRMQRQKEKHADKLKNLNIRESSKIGENVINLERENTDPYCCIILVIVFLISLGLGGYGFSRGGTSSIAPYTLDGDQCGNSQGYKNFQYLYFTDIKTNKANKLFDKAVCVKKCPKKGETFQFKPTTVFEESEDNESSYSTITAGLWCVPDPTDKSVNNKLIRQFQQTIKTSEGGKALMAIISAAPAVIVTMITAGIFSIFYIYLLANFATAIAYVVIAIFELLFIGGALSMLSMGNEGGIVGAVIFGIFLILFNLMLYCKWDEVKMAIAVIDATAEFFVETKRINLVSIMYFVLITIWVMFWGLSCIAMLSSAKFEWKGAKTPTHQERQIIYRNDDQEKMVEYMLYYQYFALLWVTLYLNESNVFALMASVSTFYFDSNSEQTGSAQVMTALKWTHVQHTGSIAMGAGIHTLIKIIFESLNRTTDNMQEGGGAAEVLACCLKCCFKCVEDILEYLNKIAYAFMAITGDKYCTSAYNGFLLNIKHLSQFYIANSLASWFIVFGTFMIILMNLGVFFGLYTAGPLGQGNNSAAARNVQVALYFVVFFVTIVISNIFLGLFDEAVLATLHCMAMDMELNEGRPKYGPPNFHDKIKEVLGEERWKEIEAERQVYYPQSYPPPMQNPMMGQAYMMQQPMGQPMVQQPMQVDQYGNPIMMPPAGQPMMMQQPGQPMMMGVPGQQSQVVQQQTTTHTVTTQQVNVQMPPQ